MHAAKHWGGAFEIHEETTDDDAHSQNMDLDRSALLRQQIEETRQGWLRGPPDNRRKEKYVDLCCFRVKWKAFKWMVASVLIAFAVIGMPTIIVKNLPKHKEMAPPLDKYTDALKKALLFFNAQRSGHLPKNNIVSWRGDSGLKDGYEVKGKLVGGYYDAGNNVKYHFPMAFSMTLLSWSVIEYNDRYKAVGEYDHIRGIIKWGTNYLLKTFDSSASTINQIYCQVSAAEKGNDNCWQRPEDMTYERRAQTCYSAPDLGSEMAAALAAASIVFSDDTTYSKKLIKGAKKLFKYAVDSGRTDPYSLRNPYIEPFYNSTGYWDEYLWSATWMFYATGNHTYLSHLDPSLTINVRAFNQTARLNVLSWDNKLPGARLLITRYRIFMDPGYPYEDMLRMYHDATNRNMCSYFRQFRFYTWTAGGLIQLNHGRKHSLQYVANTAFLMSLFADYMIQSKIPGFYCGATFVTPSHLHSIAVSQVNYILGSNPKNMSYVVGYGPNYPKHVHHRGASIPNDKKRYKCNEGMKWYRAKRPNPNIILGAMVSGPDRDDKFFDVRSNPNYTEPTLAGNAGLVAALISLTKSGDEVIDTNTILSHMVSIFPHSPPPPSPWKP